MYNSLKKEIEKEFDKEKNYHTILTKAKGMSIRKKIKVRYILAPTCVAIIAVIGLFGFDKIKNPNNDIEIGINNNVKELQSLKVELNINKIEEMMVASLDADVKTIEMSKLPEEFKFIENINIPEEYQLKSSYNVYTKDGLKNNGEYTILHDYVFSYGNDDMGGIVIAFSTIENPLRDYYIDDVNQKSKIGEIELEISQYKEMYLVRFYLEGIYFDIETNGITESELVELLQSIINEIKVRNNINEDVEDKDVNVNEPLNENIHDYPEYYAGKYVDNNGNNVILLCEDNETNRKEICDILGITQSKTIFKTGKYSYNYLEELQEKISQLMVEKQLPFVTTSSLRDDSNNILVTVTSNNESDLEKIRSLDSIGGAIEIKFSEKNAVHDVELIEKK